MSTNMYCCYWRYLENLEKLLLHTIASRCVVVKLLYRTDKKNLILSLNDISRLLNVLTAPFVAYYAQYYPSL